MKKYLLFLLLSYPTAILFEANANFFFDGVLFQQQNWFYFFVLWYGLLYSTLYFFSRKFGLIYSGIFFAILGTVAEVLVFKRSNLIADPIIYFLMALIPVYLHKRFFNK